MSDPILRLAGRNRYEKKRVAKSPVPDTACQSAHRRQVRLVIRVDDGLGRIPLGNTRRESVGYDLVSLYDTLWARAHRGTGDTFGDEFAYAPLSIRERQRSGDDEVREVDPGALGASFRGAVYGRNMARPPWGWFDSRERDRPLGEWFLDPAGIIARHFTPDEPFSRVYVHHPYLGIVEDD